MEKDFKTLGIVVKKVNVKENDILLTILTPDMGLLEVYSYGVRKSAKAVRAQLYSEGNFSLFRKKEGGRIDLKDIDIISFHEGSFSTLDKMAWVSLWSEMIIKGGNVDSEVYSLFVSTLDSLEGEDNPDRSSIFFITHYLMLSGLSGDLEYCPSCSRPYKDDEVLTFSSITGTYVCSLCDTEGGSLILPPNARRYLKRVGELTLSEALELVISDEMARRISRNLLRTLKFSFPVHLKTVDSGLIR